MQLMFNVCFFVFMCNCVYLVFFCNCMFLIQPLGCNIINKVELTIWFHSLIYDLYFILTVVLSCISFEIQEILVVR